MLKTRLIRAAAILAAMAVAFMFTACNNAPPETAESFTPGPTALPGETAMDPTPTVDPLTALRNWLNIANIDQEVIRILLLGYDEKEDTTWARNDTTMILQINTVTNEVKLVSFMRDMLVNIPGVGEDRLNNSAYRGGPSLAIRTIEQVFDVPIDYYASVTFQTFEQVFKIIGDVTVRIQPDEVDNVKILEGAVSMDGEPIWGQVEGMQPGVHELNPYQALALARDRHSERTLSDGTVVWNDLGRNERQREIIKAAWEKVKTFPVVMIPAEAALAKVYIETDMPIETVIALLMQLSQAGAVVQDMAMPLSGHYWTEYVDEKTGEKYTQNEMQAMVDQLQSDFAAEHATWEATVAAAAADPTITVPPEPVYTGATTVKELCNMREMSMKIGWSSGRNVGKLHEFLGID